MKKILFSLAAVALLASCSLLKGTSANNAAAPAASTTADAAAVSTTLTAGQAAGNALHALYTQYKADGKYDYKNINNAINATLLLANCADLPKNVKNAAYLKEFSQGLIASSAGLVTQSNVNAVTNNLTTIATEYAQGVAEKTAASETAQKAAATTNTVAEKLATAASTANSISSLLSLFGKK